MLVFSDIIPLPCAAYDFGQFSLVCIIEVSIFSTATRALRYIEIDRTKRKPEAHTPLINYDAGDTKANSGG